MDRRVRRTELALRDALVQLIVEKGYEGLSVSEITSRADVGRSTFYAHYADKDDLLQGTVEELGMWLRSQLSESTAGHPALSFVRPMLVHAADHKRVFAAMVGRRGGYLFQELVQDLWAELIRSVHPTVTELEVQGVVGAFTTVLLYWLTKEPELSVSEVDQLFQRLVAPGLGSA